MGGAGPPGTVGSLEVVLEGSAVAATASASPPNPCFVLSTVRRLRSRQVATRLVQSCSLTELSLTTALCRQLLAALDDAPAR